MNEQEEYSVLSKTAYDWYYGSHDLAKKELDAYDLPYHFDIDYSDDNSVTIVRPDGTAVLSFRGTVPSNPSDLLADAQIVLGVHSNPWLNQLNADNRFEDASKKYEIVKAKYPDLTLTGHSLGGASAIHVARRHGSNSVTFNPGSSPLGEMFHAINCGMFGCDERPQKIYTTGDDIISFSSAIFDSTTDDVVYVPKKENGSFYTHSLIHFLPKYKAVHDEPEYIRPVHRHTFEKHSLCFIFPELCLNHGHRN